VPSIGLNCSLSPAMATSPYKWKIIERGVKQQIINLCVVLSLLWWGSSVLADLIIVGRPNTVTSYDKEVVRVKDLSLCGVFSWKHALFEQFFNYPGAVIITGYRVANWDLCLALMGFSSEDSLMCDLSLSTGIWRFINKKRQSGGKIPTRKK
jgi:hypothetical protein